MKSEHLYENLLNLSLWLILFLFMVVCYIFT